MIRVGVIGYGYWGPNLVRNFEASRATEVVAVADSTADRLLEAQRAWPRIEAFGDANQLIRSPRVDAVVIATPVSTHFDLALEALRQGKHVLVEKPLCAGSEQAARLVEAAARRGLTLMVDHTFVYAGAVRRLKDLVADGSLGDLYYYDSVRVNLGLFRNDVNVVWDLACHDFSIIDYLFQRQPAEISAVAIDHAGSGCEDAAYITAFFEGAFVAHVGVNWLAPVKVRTTLLGGSRRMVVYDDLAASEKIKIYDKGVTFNGNAPPDKVRDVLVDYRTGDMHAPQIDRTEPLSRVVEEFSRCILQGEKPLSDGECGLRVVRVLEAATASIALRGAPVPVVGRERS